MKVATLTMLSLLPGNILRAGRCASTQLFAGLSHTDCQHNNIFRIARQTSALWTSEPDIAIATCLFLSLLLVLEAFD
jgi:hypothetical protein